MRLPYVISNFTVRKSGCNFPKWLQDDWQNLHSRKNILEFKDQIQLKSTLSYCVQPSYQSAEKYLVYTQNQCGYGYYNCIWIQKRSPNVLEIQFGRRPSTVPSFELCDSRNFWSKTWHTIASK